MAASWLLAGASLLPSTGTAAADAPSLPISYVQYDLPDVGPVYLPSIGGGGESCFETSDTGWVCTPTVPTGYLTADTNLTTTIDILEAPDDAVAIDTAPDPNAPIPLPEASAEITQDPPDGPSTAGPYCSGWGTATWENPVAVKAGYGTLNCPPDHWYKGYYYIQDHTSSAWPVKTYTSYWNQVNGLTVGYGCPSSSHCVKVVDGSYGTVDSKTRKRKWVGLTTFAVDGHNRMTFATVQLNDSWSLTSAERSEAVCHELGHTAGLGHEKQNTACMYYADDGTHTQGSTDDFNQLYYNTYGPAVST